MLRRAFKKYGKDNFKVELIEECNSLEEMNQKEIFYIDKFNSRNEEFGYNISIGGNQISKDERVSQAISEAIKNNFNDPIKGKYLREVLSLANKGKKLSEKHINKIKEANTGRIKSEQEIAKLSESLKGHYVSKETKEKISMKTKERNIGRHWFNNEISEVFTYECPEGFVKGRLPFSEEQKRKIGNSSKGRSCSEELKKKLGESRMGCLNPMFGKPNPHKDKIVINNNIKNKYINPEDLEIYINSGWKKGLVKK